MNDNHLYICTVPAGAGKSFLGYLQAYYRDIVPYKEEADFPIGNIWDEEKPFNVWHLQQDMPMMSLPLPRATGFDVVKSQELYRDLSKNIITNTMLLQHTFPVGIEQQWKHITHEIAVNVEDIETQEFVQKLASADSTAPPAYSRRPVAQAAYSAADSAQVTRSGHKN